MVREVGDLAGVLPVPRYAGRSAGPTIASALNSTAGAAIRATVRSAWVSVVDLGLVLAGRAHPLPEEGDRVEPEDLDAEVRVAEQDLGELGEHGGVRPVEVPLVVVERRPDPARDLVVPGEAAGREVGEDLGQRLLVQVRQVPVRVHEVVVALLGVACPGRLGPGVLAGRVVEHQVDAQADAGVPECRRELAQVVDVAEVVADGGVVGDGVPAVVRRRPRCQQRHQVQVGDPEAGQVVDVLGDALQGVAEPVGVRRVAQRVAALEPVGLGQPPRVELLQLGRPGVVRRASDGQQPVRDGLGLVVQPAHGRHQVRPPPVHPCVEVVARAAHGGQYVVMKGLRVLSLVVVVAALAPVVYGCPVYRRTKASLRRAQYNVYFATSPALAADGRLDLANVVGIAGPDQADPTCCASRCTHAGCVVVTRQVPTRLRSSALPSHGHRDARDGRLVQQPRRPRWSRKARERLSRDPATCLPALVS